MLQLSYIAAVLHTLYGHAQALATQFPIPAGLITVMTCDMITGTFLAGSKSDLSSKTGYKGVMKKASMAIVVGMCGMLEKPLGVPLANSIALYFIYVEAVSVLENARDVGVPIPKFLLDRLRKKVDEVDPPNAPPSERRMDTLLEQLLAKDRK